MEGVPSGTTTLEGDDMPNFGKLVPEFKERWVTTLITGKDPVTGKCTAISASYDWELVKAFIVHETPDEKVSENVTPPTDGSVQVAYVTEDK